MHPVGRLDGAVAGIAGAAVGIDDLQHNAVDIVLDDRPVALGDVVAAAMKVGDALFVEVELIALAVQRELAAADAVCTAPGVAPK